MVPTDVSTSAKLRYLLLFIAGLLVVAIVIGTFLLRLWSDAEADVPRNPPLTVAVQPLDIVDGYTVTEQFAGRLEASRQTRLAFERTGLVLTVLVDEGDNVAAGQVIAQLDTARLKAERARLAAQREELRAQQALAQITLERQQSVAAKGLQSAQRLDEARYQLQEVMAAIVRVEAAITAVQVDIDKSVLKAPYAGRVAARWVDEGAVVNASSAVLDVLDTQLPRVRVGVSVEAAQALSLGQMHRLSAGDAVLQGRIIAIRPDLQTLTRTVTVLLQLVEKTDLPFGDIVELLLERRVEQRGAWLPISALNEGRKGLWSVFTAVAVDNGYQVVRETVQIIHLQDNLAFVTGTLADSVPVVQRGTNRIIPGQPVTPVFR